MERLDPETATDEETNEERPPTCRGEVNPPCLVKVSMIRRVGRAKCLRLAEQIAQEPNYHACIEPFLQHFNSLMLH